MQSAISQKTFSGASLKAQAPRCVARVGPPLVCFRAAKLMVPRPALAWSRPSQRTRPAPDLAPSLNGCSTRQTVSTVIVANGKKVDISKQGLNGVKNPVVKLNLMGRSKTMEDKNWVDPQGRKGKVRRRAPRYLEHI